MKFMELFAYVIIFVIVLVVLKITSVYLQLSKSNYSKSSGNALFDVVFNTGNYGEFLTYRILEKCGENNILCNVYLPKSNGQTTEVDLISINKKGIFVYESKNYSGWIFGDEKSRNWTQCIKGGKKNKFYNPVIQNKCHINAINNFLNKRYSDYFLSYIVFSERCEFKKIDINSDKVKVINRYNLEKYLRSDKNNLPDVLTDDDISNIYNTLKFNILADNETKQKHIENINARL